MRLLLLLSFSLSSSSSLLLLCCVYYFCTFMFNVHVHIAQLVEYSSLNCYKRTKVDDAHPLFRSYFCFWTCFCRFLTIILCFSFFAIFKKFKRSFRSVYAVCTRDVFFTFFFTFFFHSYVIQRLSYSFLFHCEENLEKKHRFFSCPFSLEFVFTSPSHSLVLNVLFKLSYQNFMHE